MQARAALPLAVLLLCPTARSCHLTGCCRWRSSLGKPLRAPQVPCGHASLYTSWYLHYGLPVQGFSALEDAVASTWHPSLSNLDVGRVNISWVNFCGASEYIFHPSSPWRHYLELQWLQEAEVSLKRLWSALEETFQYFSPPPSLPMPLPSLLLPGIVLPSDILPEAVAAGSVV